MAPDSGVLNGCSIVGTQLQASMLAYMGDELIEDALVLEPRVAVDPELCDKVGRLRRADVLASSAPRRSQGDPQAVGTARGLPPKRQAF